MKIESLHFYRGPNMFAEMSGLRATCSQFAPWTEDEADPAGLETFLALLAQAMPIVAESRELAAPDFLPGCAIPEIGFALAVCEVVTRDFCVRPRIGEILETGEGTASFFVPCDDSPIGVASLKLAVGIANAAPRFRVADPDRFREHFGNRYLAFRRKAAPHKLDQSTIGLVRAAAARGIPSSRIDATQRMMQLGQGVHAHRINETVTDGLSMIGARISADKLVTGALLERFGIPTPRTHAVASIEAAQKVARSLGFPLVVKPRTGGKGVGVTVDIRNQRQLAAAFENAWKHRQGAVVEHFVKGDDHRLLVIGGRLVAAAKRVPGQVTGDGVSTVKRLVERANFDPRRGVVPFERLLERIELDGEALTCLERAGLGPDSVPGKGVSVALRGTANISRGGTAVDVTGIVHPDNRTVAERAARVIGADVLGIDFLSPDIARSWREVPSAIIEANVSPGLRPHLAANPEHDVYAPIVDLLFPPGADGRVPTVGVTGSVGKTSTVSMISAILARAGLLVAHSTSVGAWVGEERIRQGDLSYGGIGQALLQDPAVEAGVFELARGALLKSGLALDALDVGIVLGVHDNHLGIDGIETREDLARIKQLVVRNARKLAVLNADDPLTLAMRERSGAERIALVSARADNPDVLAHCDAGGLAAMLDERDELVLFDGGAAVGRIAMAELPMCWGGSFRPAAVNALFAACACHGLGIGFAIIADALKGFASDLEANPGRNNFFERLPYRLLLSHVNGPESARHLAALARGIESSGKRALFTSAGNRPDEFIRDIARNLAGAFTDYYCTDWSDLRGRAPGEVAGMLADALREAGIDPDRVHQIADPEEAVRAAYAGLGPEDFLLDGLLDPVAGEAWLGLRALRLDGTRLGPR